MRATESLGTPRLAKFTSVARSCRTRAPTQANGQAGEDLHRGKARVYSTFVYYLAFSCFNLRFSDEFD
jgi:hypothetical protein